MIRVFAWALPLLPLTHPLWAGGVEGTVRLRERSGQVRTSLADCVALLEPVDHALPLPGPSRPLAIRTLGKQFTPRVSLATPGTEVTFPNLDHILHNVFSVTQGNRFDTGHYKPGDSPKVKVTNPGLVKLYCNVHHQMNAFLWVVATPFAQLLAGRTGVHFERVPAGAYRLRLWHPECGDRTWTVQVGEGTTLGQWEMDVSLPPLEPHKNKFGRDYSPSVDDRNY